MNLFGVVQKIVQEEFALPVFVHQTIDLIGKGHLYFRAYKYGKTYEKSSLHPLKEHSAVYGAIFHLLGEMTSIGSYAVTVALITKCAEDLLQGYRNLNEDYQTLYQKIHCQYPIDQPLKWNRKGLQSILFSPSLILVWQVQIIEKSRQILKIARCASRVLWQLFKLSVYVCDARLLLNDDPQTRYMACTELMHDWERYQAQMEENQQRLIEEIQKRSVLADRILYQLGLSRNSAVILIEMRKKFLGFISAKKEIFEDISYAAQETLNTVYIKGKITALSINVRNRKSNVLPSQPFPHWGGQQIKETSSTIPATHFSWIGKVFEKFSSIRDHFCK